MSFATVLAVATSEDFDSRTKEKAAEIQYSPQEMVCRQWTLVTGAPNGLFR